MTDGIGSHKIAEQVVEKSTREGASNQTPDTPESNDVNRFDQAMKPAAEGRVDGVREAQPAQVEAAGKTQNVGDAILQGLEKMRGAYDAHHAKIAEVFQSAEGADGIKPAELLRLQYELMQLNLQTDVTTKATDKSSQGVQTLFKNQ